MLNFFRSLFGLPEKSRLTDPYPFNPIDLNAEDTEFDYILRAIEPYILEALRNANEEIEGLQYGFDDSFLSLISVPISIDPDDIAYHDYGIMSIDSVIQSTSLPFSRPYANVNITLSIAVTSKADKDIERWVEKILSILPSQSDIKANSERIKGVFPTEITPVHLLSMSEPVWSNTRQVTLSCDAIFS